MIYQIKFGTDGWRGVIAEDYTFDNLRRATQGFASYLLEKGKQGEWVVVGHDKRFASEHFAASAAEVLAGNGLNVYLTNGATPTPVIAFARLVEPSTLPRRIIRPQITDSKFGMRTVVQSTPRG